MPNNPSNSLVVDYAILRSRVGRVLGVPDDISTWQGYQRQAVDSVIEDGLRQYYQPPQVDSYGPWTWSFLYPTVQLTTVDGQRWYQLPDDFESISKAGKITYASTDQRYYPIQITSESHMRELSRVSGDSTSYPRFAAVRLLKSEGVTEQRWEIGFDPTPGDGYDLEYTYYAAPYMLSVDKPYPLGGKSHGQGILASCLAAAEIYEFEQRGHHWTAFIEQLKADIAQDGRRGPATLGYGGVTRRGGRYERSRRWRPSSGSVSYDNTDYTS